MKRGPLFACVLAAIAALATGAQNVTPGPASLQELVNAAQQAQRQNDWSTAAAQYKEALKMHPEIAELHANLGLVEYQVGDAAGASHEFQIALHLKPSLFVPNLFLGIEYLKRNKPSTALSYLSRAAQLNPRDLEVNLSIGRAYAALDKDSEAISAYLNAVTFHPANEDGWYGLGTSYLNRAESLSDLLAKRYRDSAAFHALTANYFDDQGKYARAISEYRAIISNVDAPACSHASLGFALLHNGQFVQAEDEFNLALRVPDCAPLAHIGLARIQVKNAQASATPAIEELKDDRSADFADPEPSGLSDPSQAYLSGHYRSAASLGERLIASGTLNPNTLYWTIRADQRLGVSALTQAVSVAPRSIRIHLLLGDLYRRKGQYLAGQQEFQEALKLDRNNLPALLGLATTLYLNGDSVPAEVIANQALSYKPDDPESRLLMAEILLAQHSYADALRYVDPLPNGKPDLLAEVHGVRGKIFAAIHRPSEAIAELKQAVDNDPQGNFTYVLARQYQLLGDKRSADIAFQRSKILRQKFNERASYKVQDREQN